MRSQSDGTQSAIYGIMRTVGDVKFPVNENSEHSTNGLMMVRGR